MRLAPGDAGYEGWRMAKTAFREDCLEAAGFLSDEWREACEEAWPTNIMVG